MRFVADARIAADTLYRSSGKNEMHNADVANRRSAAISRGVGVTTQVYAAHAENAKIWDVEGRIPRSSLR
jgi:4-aminobutyrate aminotransferase-like enzyme